MTEPSLIAVRRNIQAGAIFYRQIGALVQYSLDNTLWYNAFYLPEGGADTQYSSTYNWEKIEQYQQNYYKNTTTNQIILNMIINQTPTKEQYLANQKEYDKYIPSKKAICIACYSLALGYAVQVELAREANLSNDPKVNIARIGLGIMELAGTFIGIAGAPTTGGALLVANGASAGYASGAIDPAIQGAVQPLSQEDILSLACCLYEAMKSGAGNYDTFKNAGCDGNFFTWADFATPEIYSAFLAMIAEGEDIGTCPCEECYTAKPAESEIEYGKIYNSSLVTVDVVITGNVREMLAKCKFIFPRMVLTKVTVYLGCLPYENVSTASYPVIRFDAPNTGGGNTAIFAGANVIEIPEIQYPDLPTEELTLTLKPSVCSACTTAQLASYNQSWGSLIRVEVCGNLA